MYTISKDGQENQDISSWELWKQGAGITLKKNCESDCKSSDDNMPDKEDDTAETFNINRNIQNFLSQFVNH